MKLIKIIICIMICLCSCSLNISEEELDKILSTSGVFGKKEIINALIMDSKDNDILIFGETHYVQEHQEFILDFLKTAHSAGIRTLLDESLHAYGPVIDQYIKGNLKDIPRTLRYMKNYLIEGLKEFNQALPDSEKITFKAIDINHWEEALSDSFGILSAVTDLPEELVKIAEADFTHPSYSVLIDKTMTFVEKEKSTLISSMNNYWYETFTTMLKNEQKSLIYKKKRSPVFREKYLCDNVVRETAHEKKCVLNVGMNHAQKKHVMGTPKKWLSQLLMEQGYNIKSLSFFPAKAKLKHKFYETKLFSVDLHKLAAHDLTGALVRRLSDKMLMLPLTDPVFNERRFTVTFGQDNVHSYPSQIFDAIIIYPQGRIPDSMLEFPL